MALPRGGKTNAHSSTAAEEVHDIDDPRLGKLFRVREGGPSFQIHHRLRVLTARKLGWDFDRIDSSDCGSLQRKTYERSGPNLPWVLQLHFHNLRHDHQLGQPRAGIKPRSLAAVGLID